MSTDSQLDRCFYFYSKNVDQPTSTNITITPTEALQDLVGIIFLRRTVLGFYIEVDTSGKVINYDSSFIVGLTSSISWAVKDEESVIITVAPWESFRMRFSCHGSSLPNIS